MAAASGCQVIIADWEPQKKNTLRGFFTCAFPSGLKINRLMLHEANGTRWIGLPAREWTDAGGKKQYAKLIEFTSRAAYDKFQTQVMKALDAYLGGPA